MIKEENYFSWDNFDEIAEIDMHLAFLEEVINKYDYSEEDKQILANQMEKIKKGQQKNVTKLCVIGEASTGKSAFINAFLRMDLLASNALQGTTQICTFIDYSGDYRITLTLDKDMVKQEVYSNIDELRERVFSLTTSREEADKISKISIGVPSDFLAMGVQIIDTPGVNSGRTWQKTEESENLIENSDLLIVLTDANKAMPQSLMDFLAMKISDGCRSCIFVATKCDVIHNNKDDAHGIEYVLAYIKKRLRSEFKLTDGLVLPYAAMDIIDELYDDGDPSKELIELSENSERIIKKHLSEQEFFSRKSKQLRALKETYDFLLEKLNELTVRYKDEISAVKRQENLDLVSIINETYESERQSFSETVNKKLIQTADQMYSRGLQDIRRFMADLDDMVMRGQALANKQVGGLCVERISHIMSELYTYYEECRILFDNYIDTIKKKITDEFTEKSIYGVCSPDLREYDQPTLPYYSDSIWHQQIGELYDSVLKLKKSQLRGNELKPILISSLRKIVNIAVDNMQYCIVCYTDDNQGIVPWETRKLCDVNSAMYDSISRQWYSKVKVDVVQKNRDSLETIVEDETRIKNRRFNVESCSERLDNRWKGNKNGDIFN